ncbi:hypothetical protein P154DRAFT_434410 [Amniculicola lignicola CBS 123094]|uniref:Uncharacterized protein n=1 Tax=Amniculicola lignicola CBS 123094 TaxID=1392246 RepID=A0A6A5WFW2_9PLEO|nr:hypothetical protein P154DRAFT_434410 [Amniculicola lignicola CBS 123094]
MGVPSTQASNALIYCTYAAFLVTGCYIAWRLRHQSKGEWLSSNRTQKGQEIPRNQRWLCASSTSAESSWISLPTEI